MRLRWAPAADFKGASVACATIETMKENSAELLGELEDRYDNYAVLSRLFREEVDADLLVELTKSPEVEAVGQQAFDEGYTRLRAYLDSVDDVAAKKSELAIDYCGVFLGYGVDPDNEAEEEKMHAAYPYESIYVSGKKTLTSGLAEGVTLSYREKGFSPNKTRILADDHMACELEFMQYLVGCEMAHVRNGEYEELFQVMGYELDFLEKHPSAWMKAFEAAIERRSETDFYPALALMTRGWLEMDLAYLRKGLS